VNQQAVQIKQALKQPVSGVNMWKYGAGSPAMVVLAHHLQVLKRLIKAARTGRMPSYHQEGCVWEPMLLQSPFNIALRELVGGEYLGDEPVGQFSSVGWLLFSPLPFPKSNPFMIELDEHGMSEEDFEVEGEYDKPPSWAIQELNSLKEQASLEERLYKEERPKVRTRRRRQRR
jgi:hypothetical protein